jgi:hypothetical protein
VPPFVQNEAVFEKIDALFEKIDATFGRQGHTLLQRPFRVCLGSALMADRTCSEIL